VLAHDHLAAARANDVLDLRVPETQFARDRVRHRDRLGGLIREHKPQRDHADRVSGMWGALNGFAVLGIIGTGRRRYGWQARSRAGSLLFWSLSYLLWRCVLAARVALSSFAGV